MFLERFVAHCRGNDLLRSQLRALLLKVEVLDRAGAPDQDDETFAAAIELAVRTGQVQAFREFGGPGIAARIGQMRVGIEQGGDVDQDAARLMRTLGRGRNDDSDEARSRSFTKREREVLAALQQGGSDKVIGRRLGVSEHAVRFHLKNIFRKLKASDRVQALHRARDAGMLAAHPTGSSSIH